MTPDTSRPSASIQLTAFILEEQTELTLGELCRACMADHAMIVGLVDEGVLSPQGPAPEEWRFTGQHMQRAKVALRLHRDLGVNFAGAALALELLGELDSLRAQLRRLGAD